MAAKISRQAYAEMFGPTTGDKLRLADTELWLEVEKDFTSYGDEVKFGGGKVIRDGMGQSQRPSAETVDLVITNALIVDHWGIVKADVGVKNGRIAAIGKAGNPDTQPNVDIVVGPGSEVLAGGIKFANNTMGQVVDATILNADTAGSQSVIAGGNVEVKAKDNVTLTAVAQARACPA